ncbi:hypothetical protein B0H10DRAFT_2026917, partial [Mycena sp. CBHHK59/15]
MLTVPRSAHTPGPRSSASHGRTTLRGSVPPHLCVQRRRARAASTNRQRRAPALHLTRRIKTTHPQHAGTHLCAPGVLLLPQRTTASTEPLAHSSACCWPRTGVAAFEVAC